MSKGEHSLIIDEWRLHQAQFTAQWSVSGSTRCSVAIIANESPNLAGLSPAVLRFDSRGGLWSLPPLPGARPAPVATSTQTSGVNCARVSTERNFKTQYDTIEAWEIRSRTRCRFLDVAFKLKLKKLSSVTSVCFKTRLAMTMATRSGNVGRHLRRTT